MLKKLLEGLSASKAAAKAAPTPIVDISRVIRMPDPKPAAPAADSVDLQAAEDRAEAAIDSLAGQFETWMRADLDRLVQAWAEARAASKGDATAHHQLFTISHNIRGSAGSFGYPAISRLCGSLSTLVSNSRPGENEALINLHIEACRAAFASHLTDGSEHVADAVCDALEKRVLAQPQVS